MFNLIRRTIKEPDELRMRTKDVLKFLMGIIIFLIETPVGIALLLIAAILFFSAQAQVSTTVVAGDYKIIDIVLVIA